MCLLVVAWQTHPRFPLVVAANRDEFHARAAAALGPWSVPPGMLAGRDLQAGGTWLGLDGRGRLGVVTNFRERLRPRANAPSRGRLIPAFLAGDAPPGDYLASLEDDAAGYSGFSLILVGAGELWYACNRSDEFSRPLPRGVYGLANHLLDTPWPKLVRTRQRVLDWIAAGGVSEDEDRASESLFDILSDREPADTATTPGLVTGLPREWERAVSAPFVVHPQYGTRCSTVVLGRADGRIAVTERRFAVDGGRTGETHLHLDTRNPGGLEPL